jgi:hypothetical protein
LEVDNEGVGGSDTGLEMWDGAGIGSEVEAFIGGGLCARDTVRGLDEPPRFMGTPGLLRRERSSGWNIWDGGVAKGMRTGVGGRVGANCGVDTAESEVEWPMALSENCRVFICLFTEVLNCGPVDTGDIEGVGSTDGPGITSATVLWADRLIVGGDVDGGRLVLVSCPSFSDAEPSTKSTRSISGSPSPSFVHNTFDRDRGYFVLTSEYLSSSWGLAGGVSLTQPTDLQCLHINLVFGPRALYFIFGWQPFRQTTSLPLG